MPTSRPNTISLVCEWMRHHANRINSVLDIGVGFGKWGFLSREYIYTWKKDLTLLEYRNYKDFKVDAIEIFKDIITPLQNEIYNEIYLGCATEIINEVDDYDLIILGDIIEHLSKEDGMILLDKCIKKSMYTILSTPIIFNEGRDVLGNEHEKHKCVWSLEDFKKPNLRHVEIVGNQRMIIYRGERWTSQN
jgi:hypothetical protein